MKGVMTHRDREYNKLNRILNFKLPHRYKKLGYLGAASIFILLLSTKLFSDSSIPLVAKDILRTLILLFLLIASLSKDSFEDEFTGFIRFQSYLLSFVCVASYTIIFPLFTYVLDLIISSAFDKGKASFFEFSSFEILFMLICFQLLFFEALKKFGCAK